jgi:uncharacterized protein
MRLFALSDLHLAFSNPEKQMSLRFPQWANHTEKMAQAWDSMVKPNDVIAITGDISWASSLEQALIDLEWIAQRPGHKVLLKGNHDFWWKSTTKLRAALPPQMHVVDQDSVCIGPFRFFGARLWDTMEYDLTPWIDWQGPAFSHSPEDETTYNHELNRLKASILSLGGHNAGHNGAHTDIGLCHYPPCSPDKMNTRAMQLFNKTAVKHIVFGHLHGLRKDLGVTLFPSTHNIRLHLCSSDWLDFSPAFIAAAKAL